MKITVHTINQLIGQDQLEKALSLTNELATACQDDDLINMLILLSARYRRNENNWKQHLISTELHTMERSRVMHALQSVLTDLKEEYPDANIEVEMVTTETAPPAIEISIEAALKYLHQANYPGYFSIMDELVPTSYKTLYAEHKGRFMSNQAPWNFAQQLEIFTREVEKERTAAE